MARQEWFVFLLLPAAVVLHLFVAPFTKVEESFNMQAIHDILIHGIPRENAAHFFSANYDHVSFPGSVPRTFTGALILSGLSKPLVWLTHTPEQLQLLVRAILGFINAAALVWFGTSVRKAFGRGAAVWYTLFQATQFHIIYYASRTLPNMFAFSFSTISLKCLLDAHATQFSGPGISRNYRLSLYLLTLSGVIFRSELAILVATLTLYLISTRPISIASTIIPAGVGGLCVGLLCTIPIDSFFWQSTPLWPEWTAFYYNTILGHSADWGTSPWHFYLLNSIPRLMINPLTYLLCIPAALLSQATRKRCVDLLVPLLTFVGIYSFLPHKEWRFIIYIIPGLTAVAAAGASWISIRSAKSTVYMILTVGLISSVILSFAASTTLLAVSSLNYPGGEALTFLNEHFSHPKGRQFQVHLDNLACQTGVTRFLEVHDVVQTSTNIVEGDGARTRKIWEYSKTEDPELLLDPKFWTRFDYVLAERPEKVIGSWEVIHVTYGFDTIAILKPGDTSDAQGLYQQTNATTRNGPGSGAFIIQLLSQWRSLEEHVRGPILRGWWLEVRMKPRISILANRMNSTRINS